MAPRHRSLQLVAVFALALGSGVACNRASEPRASILDATDVPPASAADGSARTRGSRTPMPSAACEALRVLAHKPPADAAVPAAFAAFPVACVDAPDEQGYTPLLSAALFAYEAVVSVLLERGADARHATPRGTTALHLAVQGGSLAIVRALLARGALVGASDEDGLTPLHVAAYEGNVDIARALIAAGGPLDAAARHGETPLFRALDYARSDVARVLIEHGAKVGLAAGPGYGVSQLAARNGDDAVLTLLLDRGALLESVVTGGRTPLHEAAEYGHGSTLRLLIARGANVDAQAALDGFAPLHVAMQKRQSEAVFVLLEAHANPNIADRDGRTPLHWAGYAYTARHTEEEFGLDGEPPSLRHYREAPRSAEAVALLLAHGARPDARDGAGMTPLHEAALSDAPLVAKLLIDRGAPVNARNAKGETALALALARHYDEVAALLRARGAL